MHTFAGPDRGLWLVKERQRELMHEAAQQRLARSISEAPRKNAGANRVRLIDVFGAVAFGQSRLAALRRAIAPEPCADCADCSC